MMQTLRSIGLLVLVMVGLLFISALPAAARDRDDKCEKRIHQAEAKLNDAVRRHGEGSKQAHQRREQLEDARRRCHHEGDRDHEHDRH
jgi:hypothetical protein